MAVSVKTVLSTLLVMVVALVATLIAPAEARRHSPLLVEDEGARRNRPAGKSAITRSTRLISQSPDHTPKMPKGSLAPEVLLI